MTLITTNTESGDSESAFTSSIDSTYKLYIFKFIDIGPANDNVDFVFLGSTNGGTGYGVDKVTTSWRAKHTEADATSFGYVTGYDHPPDGTEKQWLAYGVGSAADESCAGELYLFNPSSTTYVKHFYSSMNGYMGGDYTFNNYVAGYINDTTAVDDIQFKFSAGDFDGKIKMWGVK